MSDNLFPHRFIKSADVPKLHTQWAKKGTITDIKYEFMKEQSNKMFRESLPSKQKYTIKTEETPLTTANTVTITKKDSIKANLAMIKISVTNKKYIIIPPPVTPSDKG